MHRRTYLVTAVASASTIAIAGCTGGEPDDADGDDENGRDDGDEDDDSAGRWGEHDGLVGTFDDFEDLAAWEAVYGSVEADSGQSVVGSQSARLTPNEDGEIRFRRELDETIDASDVVPGIAVDDSEPGSVILQVQDGDGDYVEYSQRVMGGMGLTRTNFGITRIRGDPDLTETSRLQVVRWYQDSDGPTDGELGVDDFHFVPKPETGAVMLQFHGGYDTHYTEAFPILQEYDLPGVAFVPTNRLGQRPLMTSGRAGELASAGWTIGSFSAYGQPLPNLGSGSMEDDIVDSAEWLDENGYADGASCFAYPGNQYDRASYDLVREHYDLAFAGTAPAQGYAGNPHLCSMVPGPDPGEVTELLEWTAEHNAVTSFAFYQLEETDALAAVEAAAEGLAQRVASGELDAITPERMADEYVV